jgi:hypothetical protein
VYNDQSAGPLNNLNFIAGMPTPSLWTNSAVDCKASFAAFRWLNPISSGQVSDSDGKARSEVVGGCPARERLQLTDAGIVQHAQSGQCFTRSAVHAIAVSFVAPTHAGVGPRHQFFANALPEC